MIEAGRTYKSGCCTFFVLNVGKVNALVLRTCAALFYIGGKPTHSLMQELLIHTLNSFPLEPMDE